jgi:hypothetical protein
MSKTMISSGESNTTEIQPELVSRTLRIKTLSHGFMLPRAIKLDSSLTLHENERDYWETVLNKNLNSCGCLEAIIGIAMGFGIILTRGLLSPVTWTLGEVTREFLTVITLLIVGKLGGPKFAELRFRLLCTRLLLRLENQTEPANLPAKKLASVSAKSGKSTRWPTW